MSELSHICPSCGTCFPKSMFTEGHICGRCIEGKENEPQCVQCGNTFPRLRGDTCGACMPLQPPTHAKTPMPASNEPALAPLSTSGAPSQPPPAQGSQASVVLDYLQALLVNPPNPRAPGSSILPPLTWDPARLVSQQVLGQMHTRYRSGVMSHAQQGGPQPAPVASRVLATAPSVPNVWFSVKLMKFNTVPRKDFEPWSRMFSGDALFTDAVEDLLKHVDAECSHLMVPPVRIYSSDQLSLRWAASGHIPLIDLTNGTIYQFYLKHKGLGGLMMSEKQAKNNLKAIIEMVVWVTHTEPEEAVEANIGGQKRRHSDSDEPPVRHHLRRTSTHVTLDVFTTLDLYQTTCECDVIDDKDEGQTAVFTVETTLTLSLYKVYDKHELACGKNKVMHKLVDSTGTIARTAKCFLPLPSDSPIDFLDEEHNMKNLKLELRCTMLAIQIVEAFEREAKEKNISIHDIQMICPVLLHEYLDIDIGRKLYLSDLLIDAPTRQFSQLNQASCAVERDLAGSTCNALAHWDLQGSGGE